MSRPSSSLSDGTGVPGRTGDTAGSVRCAIYTRKSSEEGLDMLFNSLDAQREAGMDYIKSQRSHGWVAVPALYDDGGFSGGNVERPALKRLIADIEAGKIKVIVVYKVDRLPGPWPISPSWSNCSMPRACPLSPSPSSSTPPLPWGG